LRKARIRALTPSGLRFGPGLALARPFIVMIGWMTD
jgi:hypothetical protein